MKVTLAVEPYTWLAPIVIFAMLGSMHASSPLPPEVPTCEDAQRLAAKLSESHGMVRSRDGTCLIYRYWPATRQSPENPVVLVLHGIGYYSGPYKLIADAWNSKGIEVYAMDARAHGFSTGRRGYIGTPPQAREDIGVMIQLLRRKHPAAKIFLLGESMGGAFALNYAHEKDSEIDGLILIAPALGVPSSQFLRFSNLLLIPYYLIWQRKPAVSLVDARLQESSRDPKFIAERRSDPWAYKKVSFAYLKDIAKMVKNWKTDVAPNIHVPTLILQGERDVIVSKKDNEALPRYLGVPENEKEYKQWPGVPHTLLWDPETANILAYAQQWLQKQNARQPSSALSGSRR